MNAAVLRRGFDMSNTRSVSNSETGSRTVSSGMKHRSVSVSGSASGSWYDSLSGTKTRTVGHSVVWSMLHPRPRALSWSWSLSGAKTSSRVHHRYFGI